MPEFLKLQPPGEARDIFLKYMDPLSSVEIINTSDALARITSQAVIAPEPLPYFVRSTVDGFAVRAEDTYGASDAIPLYLSVAGEIPMGSAFDLTIKSGQCAVIHTGGMLPNGANAVVMIENSQPAGDGEIEISRGVAIGENIIRIGEDVTPGEVVLPAFRRLRPADIGGLMALGMTQVSVICRPKVGIISSGDEIVPPDQPIQSGQVRDVNAYTLSSIIEQAGGDPIRFGIAGDRFDDLKQMAVMAWDQCDMLVITAGSSASTRDLTSEVIQSLGEPGILAHGLNIKPGKPSILAMCNGKPVVGLPGNPVSAFVIAWLICVPAIQKLAGWINADRQKRMARLSLNLSSQAGREDWFPVRLRATSDPGDPLPWADPIFGKSNLIFTLSRADGMIRIQSPDNGVDAGEVVEVFLI